MIPLIHIGPIQLSSYSIMVLLGGILYTVITIVLFEKVEKLRSSITNRILILSIFGFVCLAGSALIINSIFHSIEKGQIVIGGITWLGGVLGAFPAMLCMMHTFCPLIKGEALQHFNLLLPGIVMAHGFGRIGCFLGGCCFGVVTDSFWGISFPAGSVAAQMYPAQDGGSLPVLPSQLFEACFEFLLFIMMVVFYKRMKRHFVELYAFSYGIFRFLLEFVRGDDRGTTGFFLSPSQFMSLLLIIGGFMVLLYNKGVILRRLRAKMDEYKELRPRDGDMTSVEVMKTIQRLKKLADRGTITEEEFAQKKNDLLNRL